LPSHVKILVQLILPILCWNSRCSF